MTGHEARDYEREAAWGEFRDGPNYQPTDRYDARSVWDSAWDAARKRPEPEVTDEMVKRGWRAINGAITGYQVRRLLEAALRVPVGEGEIGVE